MNQDKKYKYLKYSLYVFYTVGIVLICLIFSSLNISLNNDVTFSSVYKYESAKVINKDIVDNEYIVKVETKDVTGEIYSKELYDEIELGEKIEVPVEKQLNKKGEIIGSKIVGLK